MMEESNGAIFAPSINFRKGTFWRIETSLDETVPVQSAVFQFGVIECFIRKR